MTNKEYVTTNDLTDRFKVSKQAISKWRKQGLPCYRLGEKLFRYHMEEVEQWLFNRGSERAKK